MAFRRVRPPDTNNCFSIRRIRDLRRTSPRESSPSLSSTGCGTIRHGKSSVSGFRRPLFSFDIAFLDVLQKRPTTPTLKTYTIAYLRDQTKSFEYTLSVMATLEQQIHDEIARLGGNAKLEKIMQMLHVPT